MTDSEPNALTVALVGEFAPPHAGMAVQAELLLERLPRVGVTLRRICTNQHFTGVLSWLNNARGMRGVLRLASFLVQCVRIPSSDLVHVYSSSGLNFYLFTLPPVLLCRLLGKPVVINYHGGFAADFFEHRRGLLAWALKGNSSLVVPSGYLNDVFTRLGHEPVIIANIVNTDRFSYRRRDPLRPNILSVRNFTEVYNVACAIRAFAAVQQDYPEATLTLAGDGPLRASLEQLVKELNLTGVTFLGNIPNAEMNRAYDSADLFLNTSNIDNLPTCILEAFASGLPVVSTGVGGIPYLVEDGVTGLLAPADDDMALAAHLKTLFADPARATAMAEAGHNTLSRYDWETVCRDWVEHYRELLAR